MKTKLMTKAEVEKKLSKIETYEDFQDQFFYEDFESGYMIPLFEIVWWNGETFTINPAARNFDRNGNCTNAYIKCSDGYVEYPF